jgi:hypothetical protein
VYSKIGGIEEIESKNSLKQATPGATPLGENIPNNPANIIAQTCFPTFPMISISLC